ncbi:phage tail tape measure protein, partial [Gordonibacter urolithinfaciens]|uniref:phage tail tape measure protein n=1 Tax=Gordonibacter urolithinfaciens TaxID=1335613 RepID=UPI003A8CAB41
MARDAYKNLKIKFEGDDTDLSQAMRDVKKESNAAASELRDVEKALKLDPSNVELLAQKESYAAKEAESLKRRMDLVNSALADPAVERGSMAYDRLQRELVRTRSELSGMGGDAEKASRGLKDVAEQAERAAARLDKVGNALSVGVTAPVTAGAAALVAFGVDADNSMATLEAAVGDGTEQAEKLRKVGKDLWKRGWSDSMGELTPALVDAYEVLGDISEEDMSAAVRGAKTMERVWGADVNESLRGVNVLMTRFGISAQEATDLMVAGSQRGLNYTDELGDNLAEYAGRWADAGMSASQYFSLLEAGVEAGAYNLDKVGDYLNEFLTSLSDGRLEEHIGKFSEGTQELFRQYKDGGATAQDMLNAVIGELKGCSSETEAATMASEIWSSLGEDNAMSVITALAGVSDSYADVAGSADGAASDIEDSIGNRATAAVNSLKDSFEPFAERAVDLLERVAGVVEDVSAWFSSLDEGTQQLIVDGVALAATAGPLLKVGGGLVRGAGKLSGKLAGAGSAAKGLTGAAKGAAGASKATGAAMEAAGAASTGMA